MKFIKEWKAALKRSKDLQHTLSNFHADMDTAFRDSAKNKYRIEELDIRLCNLELMVKGVFKKLGEEFKDGG